MLDSSNPGRAGLEILRSVTRPEWLRQPRFDFSLFKRFPALDIRFDSGRPALHEYDKSAMYLGAAASGKFGVGVPEFVSFPQIEDRAGLWHIVIDSAPADGLANLLPPIAKSDSWQYTPVVELLRKFGYQFHASEAWLFPEQHQVLRPFYERMKDARERAETPEALSEIKRIYTVTFGILAHAGEHQSASYLYRPDWWNTLVSEAKARMFYQMRKVLEVEQVAPSAVKTDALYYPVAVSGLPLGAGIGQFKYKCLGD